MAGSGVRSVREKGLVRSVEVRAAVSERMDWSVRWKVEAMLWRDVRSIFRRFSKDSSLGR